MANAKTWAAEQSPSHTTASIVWATSGYSSRPMSGSKSWTDVQSGNGEEDEQEEEEDEERQTDAFSRSSRAAKSNSTIRAGTSRGRPSTQTSSRPTAQTNEPHHILAIAEGRGAVGRGDVGVCVMNIRSSICQLFQFADTQTYVKTLQLLHLFQPIEILISSTTAEPHPTKLYRLLLDAVGSDISMTSIGRKYFSDIAGLKYIRQYGVEEHQRQLEMQIADRFFALAAAAALLKYIEGSQKITFQQQTVKFQYSALEGLTTIDANTARNLELGDNLSGTRKRYSLFAVLNNTATPMGARLLRSNILQPLFNLGAINLRLDAVNELLSKEELYHSLHTDLKLVSVDLDWLIAQFVHIVKRNDAKNTEHQLQCILLLKTALVSLEPMAEQLSQSRNQLLLQISKVFSLEAFARLAALIDKVINEDAVLHKNTAGNRNQKCYAVKAGINSLLDVARRTYTETVSDIYALLNSYIEMDQHPFTLKVTTAGYLLQLALSKNENLRLSPRYVNVIRRGKYITCTTLDLMKYNDRMNESLSEIFMMSSRTLEDLSNAIRASVASLYAWSEALALLDMLVSFATTANINNYVQPGFGDTLCLREARHPIGEHIQKENFIPNDTFCNNTCNFQIITGMNMSGKSTYLRQIALIQITAQLGSYVPASFATLRLTDKIFSRLTLDDKVETNASSFMLEMQECAYCLQNVTDRSLVIIDELGRGTSTQDGVGITYAISEALINTKAFVFFATHFLELSQLEVYPNVINYHLSTQKTGESTKFLFKVSAGLCSDDGYGLRLAELAGFEPGVLQDVQNISKQLKQSRSFAIQDNQAYLEQLVLRKKAIRLFARLCELNNVGTLTDAEERQFLRSLMTHLDDISALLRSQNTSNMLSSTPQTSSNNIFPSHATFNSDEVPGSVERLPCDGELSFATDPLKHHRHVQLSDAVDLDRQPSILPETPVEENQESVCVSAQQQLDLLQPPMVIPSSQEDERSNT